MNSTRAPGQTTCLQSPGRIPIALGIVAVATFTAVGIVVKDPAIPVMGTLCTASLAAAYTHRTRQAEETADEADEAAPVRPPTLLIAFVAFHRSTKTGFSRRWLQVMATWGALWLLVTPGMTILWRGELWFALTGIGAITAVTTWGAWREARQ